MIRKFLLGSAFASVLVLAGCGTDPGDRALSGSMIGAAGGAIVGAAVGNPAAGAAIGAGAGALTGAVTDPCALHLGAPFWHNDRRAYERRCGHPPR